jgi:hypothetical protein
VWVLSLDCAGNASSTSTESGYPESLVWSWEWVWEWACSGTEANESNAESGARASPPAEAGQPPQASSAGYDEAVAEPWVWTWTFTFCGETRTISTLGGTGTPLTWTWDWRWTWTCPTAAAPDVQPPPAIDASPPLVTAPPAGDDGGESPGEAQRALQLADDSPTTSVSTVWFPSVSLGLGLGPSVEVDIATLLPTTLEVEVAIPLVVLPATTALPLPSPAIPFPAADVAAEPTTTSPAASPTHATIDPQPTPTASPRYEAQPSHAQPRAHHARPAKHTRTRAEPSKRDQQQPPLERRQSRQALGSSSAGGIVPSALLFGFAALTGFIVLAAPGLGRRIRVARALRPRSLDRPPIDHPG